jgi:hypothetical protein
MTSIPGIIVHLLQDFTFRQFFSSIDIFPETIQHHFVKITLLAITEFIAKGTLSSATVFFVGDSPAGPASIDSAIYPV